MDGIHQFDSDLVRAGRQQGHVNRGSTHVRPQPRQVVHVYVKMSNPWRCVEGILAGLRSDIHVFTRHVIQTMPLASRSGSGGSTMNFAGGSFVVGLDVSARAAIMAVTIATVTSNIAIRFISRPHGFM